MSVFLLSPLEGLFSEQISGRSKRGTGLLVFSDLLNPQLPAGRRGYVPAAKLLRYRQAVEDPPPSPLPTPTESMLGFRRHSYSPEVRPMAVGTTATFQVSRSHPFFPPKDLAFEGRTRIPAVNGTVFIWGQERMARQPDKYLILVFFGLNVRRRSAGKHPRAFFFAPKFAGVLFLHLCESAPCR